MKSAKEFCEILDIDKESTADIVALDKKICKLLGDKVITLAKAALKDGITKEEYLMLLKSAEELGKEVDEDRFRMQLIFALYCFTLLENKYELAGISKSVYNETIIDFRYRLYECKEVYGINGIFVAEWYWIMCNLSLHKIGEMEFEKVVAKFDYTGKGVTVNKGDNIIALHIPPKFKMSRETVTKAIKESYDYYGFSGKVVYQCNSWLLYPGFEKVFVEGGNVSQFRTFFDIIDSTDSVAFNDCWRLFKVGKIVDLDSLPKDTRLQRNMINHLKTGGKTGDGFGVLVFDGEKIL